MTFKELANYCKNTSVCDNCRYKQECAYFHEYLSSIVPSSILTTNLSGLEDVGIKGRC